MKWVDYRDKLGIGLENPEKFKMLKNNILTFVDIFMCNYSKFSCLAYCRAVGELYQDTYLPQSILKGSLYLCISAKELISKYIAFHNTYDSKMCNTGSDVVSKNDILVYIKKSLDNLNIQYDILEDDDGVFIFPKGAKELDDSLVSEPLEWLTAYPRSRTAFAKALKQYSEATSQRASDVADLFRKALETFFQEFFNGNKSLENYKRDYGTYLKAQGIPKEISSNFETLLQSYTLYINNYAKHRDATSDKVLEYIMYQTGNVIRLLITLKQEENTNAD